MGRRFQAAAFGLFALFALIAVAGSRAAFAEDSGAAADSGADWERVDSGSSAESADQVLEIPQAACGDDASIPCDDSAGNSPNNDDDGIPTTVAVQPASPQTYDGDTASADSNSNWGDADDYNNQIYGVPYGAVQYGATSSFGNGNPSQIRRSPFPFSPLSTSSPITQAAQPPLHSGSPWMTPSSMMMFSHPAGSPMAGTPFRFH